jgi:hypothetical protein
MGFLSDLFGSKGNDAAQQAQQMQAQQAAAEAARQERIREGQGGIDKAFGQFNPAYYDKFRQSFSNFYTPQVADQYARAKDKLVATLAGRGMHESTVGAAKYGDLEKTRTTALTDIGNKGMDASNDLRSKVEGAKTNLYGLNVGASDPAMMASQAQGAAASIAAPSLSPLGQVFSSTLQGFATMNKADANSMRPAMPWNQYGTASLSGRGSALYG